MRVLFIVFIFASVAGCLTPRTFSDRESNGYILAGWMVSPSHYWMGGIPSEVFAIATPKLDAFVKKQSGDSSDEAFFVPESSGYRVVILTRKRLSDRSLERVSVYAHTAMSQAWEQAKPLLRKRQ